MGLLEALLASCFEVLGPGTQDGLVYFESVWTACYGEVARVGVFGEAMWASVSKASRVRMHWRAAVLTVQAPA